jgi:ornithine cyclodeaminase
MLGIMPGAMENPACYGTKLISLLPDNPAHGHSSHLGMMVLFEREFGTPTAIMNAGLLTAIRTAAASAVATRALARKDANSQTIN